MAKQNAKRVWIDPKSITLAYLSKTAKTAVAADRRRGEGTKKNGGSEQSEEGEQAAQRQVIVEVKNPEIVAPKPAATQVEVIPAPKCEVLPPQPALPAPQLQLPSLMLEPDLQRTELQLREMFATLDFRVPEGFLDRCFKRPTHRLNKKIEHAGLIAEFQAAMVRNLNEKVNLASEVRRYEQVRQKQFLDALIAWRAASEAYCHVQNVAHAMAREQAVENAKAEALIARYRADTAESNAKSAESTRRIREAERPPQPQLPPPLSPTQDQIREQNRTRVKNDIERLKQDEADEIADLTQNEPEAEWSLDLQDEVRLLQNVYADARKRKVDHLRRYL